MSTSRETGEVLRPLNSPAPTITISESGARTEKNASDNSSSQITPSLITLALACSLGFFSFGYQLVVLNGPGVILEAWINESYVCRGFETNALVVLTEEATGYDVVPLLVPGLSASTVTILYGVATGALAMGAVFGAMFAGSVADWIGRRGGQLVGAAIALLAAGVAGLSGYIHSPELLMIGRAMFGISAGAATALAPMYLVESSPPTVRGIMSTLTQMGFVIGMFLCQILGLPQFFGTERRWPLLFLVAGLAPAIQIVLTLLSPESPRFLYISRNQSAASQRSLGRLRSNRSSVKHELADFETEAQTHRQSPPLKLGQLLTRRRYFWPLLIAVVLHLSQAWCGVQGIQGYSSILFQRAGLSATDASYANLLIGVISIITAVALTLLIDRLGRRVLHLGGLAGMLVFGILIVVFSKLPDYYPNEDDASIVKLSNQANIVCVLVFVAFFSLGPVSIPWTIVSELFSQKARGPATSVCCFVNWLSAVINFMFYPSLQRVLGVYVFLPFVLLLTVFVLWLWKYMPETKGRTLNEISASLNRS